MSSIGLSIVPSFRIMKRKSSRSDESQYIILSLCIDSVFLVHGLLDEQYNRTTLSKTRGSWLAGQLEWILNYIGWPVQ
jgi:hypothetical protein